MQQQFPQDYPSYPQAPQRQLNRKRVGIVSFVLALLVILTASMIVHENWLKIKSDNIEVKGLEQFSKETVINAAGLDQPVSYFAINESKIAQGIESNRYLVYEGLEKHFPHSLTLYVRERKSVVMVQELGAIYYLDEEGMVLERKQRDKQKQKEEESSDNPEELIVVTGLKPKDLRVGKIMTTSSASHMTAYIELLGELSQQGFLNEVSELNLTDPENLYLVTQDGYTVHLGDASQLRPKIGTVRAVVAELRRMGKIGGMLEASIPEEVIYSPASP